MLSACAACKCGPMHCRGYFRISGSSGPSHAAMYSGTPGISGLFMSYSVFEKISILREGVLNGYFAGSLTSLAKATYGSGSSR